MMADNQAQKKWSLNFILLLIISFPAFSGFPLDLWRAQIVSGITWTWVLYFILAHLVIRFMLGRRLYANILTVAAWVALPVVFAGAVLSWLGTQLGIGGGDLYTAGRHYARLCLTMLTVVPLALALVAVVPFGQMERNLVLRPVGVTVMQKKVLMALRVFNHIAFFVIPNILEVLREEQPLVSWRLQAAGNKNHSGQGRFGWIAEGVRVLTWLAVEGICAAVQYIPLWAHEIAQLPQKKRHSR